MFPYNELLSHARKITDSLYFKPLAGADAFPLTAQEITVCSTPGQNVFVDMENHCVITRTSNGVYLSLQKTKETLESQLPLLERLARMHS